MRLQDFERVTYQSIPSWEALWERSDKSIAPHLLGALVAWEAMRFLALGGQKVVLCEGLQCNATVSELWTDCFRKQLGEWRTFGALIAVVGHLPGMKSASASKSSNQIEVDGEHVVVRTSKARFGTKVWFNIERSADNSKHEA